MSLWTPSICPHLLHSCSEFLHFKAIKLRIWPSPNWRSKNLLCTSSLMIIPLLFPTLVAPGQAWSSIRIAKKLDQCQKWDFKADCNHKRRLLDYSSPSLEQNKSETQVSRLRSLLVEYHPPFPFWTYCLLGLLLFSEKRKKSLPWEVFTRWRPRGH